MLAMAVMIIIPSVPSSETSTSLTGIIDTNRLPELSGMDYSILGYDYYFNNVLTSELSIFGIGYGYDTRFLTLGSQATFGYFWGSNSGWDIGANMSIGININNPQRIQIPYQCISLTGEFKYVFSGYPHIIYGCGLTLDWFKRRVNSGEVDSLLPIKLLWTDEGYTLGTSFGIGINNPLINSHAESSNSICDNNAVGNWYIQFYRPDSSLGANYNDFDIYTNKSLVAKLKMKDSYLLTVNQKHIVIYGNYNYFIPMSSKISIDYDTNILTNNVRIVYKFANPQFMEIVSQSEITDNIEEVFTPTNRFYVEAGSPYSIPWGSGGFPYNNFYTEKSYNGINYPDNFTLSDGSLVSFPGYDANFGLSISLGSDIEYSSFLRIDAEINFTTSTHNVNPGSYLWIGNVTFNTINLNTRFKFPLPSYEPLRFYIALGLSPFSWVTVANGVAQINGNTENANLINIFNSFNFGIGMEYEFIKNFSLDLRCTDSWSYFNNVNGSTLTSGYFGNMLIANSSVDIFLGLIFYM
jgi:hypothetical protein